MFMNINKSFSFSVFFVVLVMVKFSASEDVVTELPTNYIEPVTNYSTTTMETTTLEVDPISEVICALCACADGIVNCANRSINAAFEITDWEGLKAFQPTSVDLSQNPLTTITRISSLPIQVLNFSYCDIGIIEDASFIYLEDLIILDLSKNQISTSSLKKRAFCGPLDPDKGPREFKNMQYLSLAQNDLHTLPQDIFLFMPTLTILDLSGNPLAYIDQVTMGAISDLKNLVELRLSDCELETLPAGLLRRQRKLKRLDLSSNKFITIPAVLQEASNLVYLNLDKTSLQTLDANNAISNLTKLQELHLSRLSRLQNITTGALGGLPSLVSLHLNYNPRLTNLDPGFLVWKDLDDEDRWPVLRELYLNNNNLSSISSHILDSWTDLATGDFSSNSYNCDCNNQWMVDVLVPLISKMPNNSIGGSMVCKKPSDLRGLTFAQLFNMSKILVCPQSENLSMQPVSNMAILLGIMIGIVVTFPLVLIVVLLWRRGYFSKLRKNKYPGYYDEETEDM